MSKLGMVCEGGGARGSYTAGVLCWCLDNNIPIDYVNGISAGAFTAIQYVSKQKDRLRSTSTKWIADSRYIGIGALFNEGSFVGIKFAFDKLRELEPFDDETFHSNPVDFEFGVFNCGSGEVEYHGKDCVRDNYDLFRTSCRLPILSPLTENHGNFYFDGGVRHMVPIYRAEEVGVPFNFVVLTKPDNYVRKPENKWQMRLIKFLYGKRFPKLIEHLNRRHTEFKEEVDYCYEGEKKGTTLVLRPSIDMKVGRLTSDVELLDKMFELGYNDCEMRKEKIMALVNRAKGTE